MSMPLVELRDLAIAAPDRMLVDGIDVAYSDHDLLRPDGRCATPSYKPDFSPERLRSQNYITHFLVARRSLVEQVGGFVPGFDGAQDHDLVLRLNARTNLHGSEAGAAEPAGDAGAAAQSPAAQLRASPMGTPRHSRPINSSKRTNWSQQNVQAQR